MTELRIMDHNETAELIVDTVNVYGRLVPQRYSNEERLIYFIMKALQSAFDAGFRAAGGTVGVTLGEQTIQEDK